MKLFLESGAVSIVLFIILAIIGMVSAVEKMKKEAKNPNADLKNNTDKMLFVINEVKNTIKGDSDKKSKDEIAEEDEEQQFWNKDVKKAKDAKVLEREVKAKAAFVKEYDGEHQDFRSVVERSRKGTFISSVPQEEGISVTVSAFESAGGKMKPNLQTKEIKSAAQINEREESNDFKRRMRENPKDIIIFSEVMTPKFREF